MLPLPKLSLASLQVSSNILFHSCSPVVNQHRQQSQSLMLVHHPRPHAAQSRFCCREIVTISEFVYSDPLQPRPNPSFYRTRSPARMKFHSLTFVFVIDFWMPLKIRSLVSLYLTSLSSLAMLSISPFRGLCNAQTMSSVKRKGNS